MDMLCFSSTKHSRKLQRLPFPSSSVPNATLPGGTQVVAAPTTSSIDSPRSTDTNHHQTRLLRPTERLTLQRSSPSLRLTSMQLTPHGLANCSPPLHPFIPSRPASRRFLCLLQRAAQWKLVNVLNFTGTFHPWRRHSASRDDFLSRSFDSSLEARRGGRLQGRGGFFRRAVTAATRSQQTKGAQNVCCDP